MKKMFVIFGLLFAMPCFATGVSGDAGTCDSGALGTDGGSTILRANYEPETIHLRWYDENNNLLTVNSASQSCTYGDSITIPTAPTKTGYRFTGWSVFSDYTPIEYIESTGTQYIDTGFSAPNGFKAQIGFYPYAYSACIIGAHNSSFPFGRNYVSMNGNGIFNIGSDGCYLSDSIVSLNTKYDIEVSTVKNNVFLTGYTLHPACDDATGDMSSYTLYLFRLHGYDVNNFIGRIYYTKIWDENNVLVRDMIPVKDIHGVACMYDKVSGQFFYNQGTGNFIAGPEI